MSKKMPNEYQPIIKWVGGKSEILSNLFEHIPTTIQNYYECFAGGGSVFLHLLERIEKKKIIVQGEIYINDLNSHLINLYKTIQTDVDGLIEYLKYYDEQYKKAKIKEYVAKFDFTTMINSRESVEECVEESKNLVYYYLKKKYNTEELDVVEKSALFIFLNKTCFRGLYRESKKLRQFNVPFGNYENPTIYQEESIRKLHDIFNKYPIHFENKSYRDFLKEHEIQIGDFIYFDPPYYPIKEETFVDYQGDGFDENEHKYLMKIFNDYHKMNVKVMMSNHKCEFIDKYIKTSDGFEKIILDVKRRINSKNPESKIEEYIIYNEID